MTINYFNNNESLPEIRPIYIPRLICPNELWDLLSNPQKNELKKITYLRANNCLIKKIPETISNLTNLKDLILSGNKLTTLPDELGQLKHLINLELDNNQLNKIPESIGEIKTLQGLSLNQNKLTKLPASLIKIPLLRVYIDNNPLRKLLDSIQINETQLINNHKIKPITLNQENIKEYLVNCDKMDYDLPNDNLMNAYQLITKKEFSIDSLIQNYLNPEKQEEIMLLANHFKIEIATVLNCHFNNKQDDRLKKQITPLINLIYKKQVLTNENKSGFKIIK